MLYAAAFYAGGKLRIEKVTEGSGENEKIYSGGQVIAIMFSVIFGAFNVGAAIPHLKSLTEGRLAGRLAYNVID